MMTSVIRFFFVNGLLITILGCQTTTSSPEPTAPSPKTSAPATNTGSPAQTSGSPSSTGADPGAQQTGTANQENTSSKEKTDDEILAEALGEFAKKPEQMQAPPASSSAGTGQDTLTEREKTGKLNEQLEEKFAKFDDLILSKKGLNSQKGDGEGNSEYAGTGTNEPGFDDDYEEGQEKSGLETAMSEENTSSSGVVLTGSKKTSSTSEIPKDIGNGEDDDILARQLREAATKEKDPVLRAKLWDEYRKYKKES